MKKCWPLFLLICSSATAQNTATPVWKFAVSGDSRNCGDIVMPAIASGARQSGAKFYWHLGDFRAIYTYDEDMGTLNELGLPAKPPNPAEYMIDYKKKAWPDFIAHQMKPFGDLPVFLSIGNHEMISHVDRRDYLAQFAHWLDTPVLRKQRLKDDSHDRSPHSYYHWISRGVDFIALDNASPDQLDSAQLKWFHSLIQRDEASNAIRTIVVGMHAALPDSVGFSHSMNESVQGTISGRDVYEALWHAQNSAHKRVYVLASHSHFYMEDVYQTAKWNGKVLPGWIVGTAGAVRYDLPIGTIPGDQARRGVYGYLAATVMSDGSVVFSFQELSVNHLLTANRGRLPEALVRWCYSENKQYKE